VSATQTLKTCRVIISGRVFRREGSCSVNRRPDGKCLRRRGLPEQPAQPVSPRRNHDQWEGQVFETQLVLKETERDQADSRQERREHDSAAQRQRRARRSWQQAQEKRAHEEHAHRIPVHQTAQVGQKPLGATEWKTTRTVVPNGGADRHADKGAEPMMAAASLKRSSFEPEVCEPQQLGPPPAAQACCRWRSRRRPAAMVRWGGLTASAPNEHGRPGTPPQNEDGHERYAVGGQIGVTWPCTSASLKLRLPEPSKQPPPTPAARARAKILVTDWCSNGCQRRPAPRAIPPTANSLCRRYARPPAALSDQILIQPRNSARRHRCFRRIEGSDRVAMRSSNVLVRERELSEVRAPAGRRSIPLASGMYKRRTQAPGTPRVRAKKPQQICSASADRRAMRPAPAGGLLGGLNIGHRPDRTCPRKSALAYAVL